MWRCNREQEKESCGCGSWQVGRVGWAGGLEAEERDERAGAGCGSGAVGAATGGWGEAWLIGAD